ncbi:hypothetical protein PUNSTDRAFT_68915, partial [Punctularia strigosozonata HHB-11173 SS5]|uniref:uncharacterized protein n=1 Tax=Punctularia strigosozonata (strain HHB-11173) TaxID=741275 RepID=UPI00044163D3
MARSEARQQATYPRAASSLAQYFAQKEEMLDAKIKRLREEYLALHVKWVQQCSKLETAPKIVAPPPEELPAAPTGRTTRRSAATLGDAVRSDLELEQIISTLGNEDMLDPSILCLRNVAKIPDMISATHGQVEASFDDTNNLVDNPGDFYAPRSGFEDWTDEEKEIFNEKYAAHPKQFGII